MSNSVFEFNNLEERNDYFQKFMDENKGLLGDYGKKYKITNPELGKKDEGTRISSYSCCSDVPYAYCGIDYYNSFLTFYTNPPRKKKSDKLILKQRIVRGIAKELTRQFIQEKQKKYAVWIQKDGEEDWVELPNLNSNEFKNCDMWGVYPREIKSEQDLTTSLQELIPLFRDYITQAKNQIMSKSTSIQDNNDDEDDMIKDAANLLQTKKNIILQGAPGTGKTYNTAALALSIVNPNFTNFSDHDKVMEEYKKLLIKLDEGGHVCNDGLIGFVTFHQSMDYEDFVEGIKPIVDENEFKVHYKVTPGIFKSIATKAKEDYALRDFPNNSNSTKKNFNSKNTFANENIYNFDFYWKKLIKSLRSALETQDRVELKYGIKPQYVTRVDDTHVYMNGSYTKDAIKQLWNQHGNNEDLRVTDIHRSGNISNQYAILRKLQEICNDPQNRQESRLSRNYVLIIDEINRGNVSKIFGELISLLEADKRVGGGNHPLSVTLPYSKESFSVPSNLYIIGTMNTTDRSVGSIDYAVRRRFAFVTLKADERHIRSNEACELFKAVKNFLDESKYDMDIDDLMVGHSYFMDDENLQMKWQYEILPLLMEYHKDGIINKSPLKDREGNDIENVKCDYSRFTSAWQKKESEKSKN